MDKTKSEIFSENFKKLLEQRNITQYKLIKDLSLKKTTVNNWYNGRSMPKYDKLQILADYFGVPISALTEDNPDRLTGIESKTDQQSEHYYYDKETQKVAEELRTNKDLKILFDTARDAKPEDLQAVHAMLLALKRKEQHLDE